MRLQTILSLVLVFAGIIHEIEATCDATQAVSCDGTVGQPLYLQMISKEKAQRMQQEYELKLQIKNNNGESKPLRFKKNSQNKPRWTFCPDNGTLIINPVEGIDFGMYKVEIYRTNGAFVASSNMTLINASISGQPASSEATIMTPAIQISTNIPPTSISNIKLHQHSYKLSKECQNFFYTVMVVSGTFGVFFLCLTVSGGIFYFYNERKRCRSTLVY
ncbi:uncharacterized protein LOC121694460 [Alosa sapidissima]|uniref:uncharacterized protein LOC121694460 n=1 Tax=Alosa sapidissima TaxID=34773 RepID=UPI001C097669|nr:uncharacterized protein LOC121694460 [Alosa sapidissima]